LEFVLSFWAGGIRVDFGFTIDDFGFTIYEKITNRQSPIVNRLMATLYVTEPGARLEKEYKRLRVVSKEGQTLLATPLVRVSEVVLVGWAGATTPAMLTLLDADIGLTFLTRQGKLRGRLTPPTGKNLPLRRQQYQRAGDDHFCLRLSRAIVAGKLRNSRTMARRMMRGGIAPADASKQIEQLKACLEKSTRGADIASLMGQEGRGAKAYFVIFRSALKERLQFDSRTRRPPKDPVNALLSLGYSLLTANLISALEVVGLDPYCGFFHGPTTYGRPALALDLMEEFRPVIVDSVVLTVVNKRMLSEKDFETSGSGDKQGVYLTRRGLRIFFEQYTHRLNTSVFHPLAGRALSYQKIFEVQARQAVKLIQGEIDEYQPFLVK
jgi:CRISPR-associated protein Cas1